MSSDGDRNSLADALLQARDDVKLTPRPSERLPDFSLEQAYQVGRLLHQRLDRRGFRLAGRKIGFTNPVTWQEFQLNTPIWAPMYEQTISFAEEQRFRHSLDRMTAPRLEPEVVLKLKSPISNGDLTEGQLARCIEWAAVGYEIVDCHYLDWRFTAADAVADFGVHAALVVGRPWQLDSSDAQHIAQALQTLKVSLRGGNEFSAVGEGRNALGSPLLALGFLARVIKGQAWAPPLAAGEIITTGTLTAPPHLRRGESYRVEVAGAPLAPLEIILEG
jgi:2-keto-4-pentenoate hydratase